MNENALQQVFDISREVFAISIDGYLSIALRNIDQCVALSNQELIQWLSELFSPLPVNHYDYHRTNQDKFSYLDYKVTFTKTHTSPISSSRFVVQLNNHYRIFTSCDKWLRYGLEIHYSTLNYRDHSPCVTFRFLLTCSSTGPYLIKIRNVYLGSKDNYLFELVRGTENLIMPSEDFLMKHFLSNYGFYPFGYIRFPADTFPWGFLWMFYKNYEVKAREFVGEKAVCAV